MFEFRRELADQFLLHDERAFVTFVVAHLRAESPELVQGLSDSSLSEMVVRGLARAKRHGLKSAADLIAFVSLMFEIAPNFDEHPEIRDVLRALTSPIVAGIDELLARVSDSSWTEAEAAYRPAAWYDDNP